MNGPKPDKLDNLIMQAFREEAQRIVVPPSTLLWGSLQQQLENRELRKTESGQFEPQDTDIPPLGKEISSRRRSKTWKKGSYLAGFAAAACLFLFFIYTASPEGSGLRNYFSQILPPSHGNQDLKTDMCSLQQDGPAPESALEMGKSMAKDFSGEIKAYSTEEPEEVGGEPGLFTNQSKVPAKQPPGLPERLDGGNRSFMEIAGVEIDEGPGEIYWQDEEAFLRSLGELVHKTEGTIFFFADLPDSYTFHGATVTETDHRLQNIYQEFINNKGSVLSLNQLFPVDEPAFTQAMNTMDTSEENGVPFSLHSFKGYLVRSPEDKATLTWINTGTIITLSGQIEEEMQLEKYLGQLKNY